MNKVKLLVLLSFFIVSCSTVPITGRKRLNLVGDEQVLPASFTQYDNFLKEHTLSKNVKETNEIREVGKNISEAVDRFMRANGMTKEANSYKWEFNLVEDKTINAWCMPGGKVVFYTGILPICKNKDGIATVMGHEIAHAFAKHGQERMTTGMLQQAGGIAVALSTSKKDPKTRQIWNTAFGVSSTLGVLAFSRTHESEADKLGMVFMIMAGYNPQEAINLWVRMSQQSKGNKPPEFLSTHPSDETRIKNLKAYLPTAVALAKKYNAQFSSTKS
ncbi:MAG: M48 family metallopeptidase [Lutibacter sp.]